MPERLTMSPASISVEKRLWAEAFADLHYAISLMAERAEDFMPGEYVGDFRAAWERTRASLETVVRFLEDPQNVITVDHMIRTDLTGPTGALKLKIIKAQGDEFLAYAVPEPRTEQNMRRAAEAGERLADMSGAVVQSLKALASEFPGVGTALEGTGEALAATKHLLGWRWWPWRRR